MQLSRFCRDYPDIGSVIPIFGSKIPALAHATPSIIILETLTNTWPRANSTLEISVQAGEERRYNGGPTSEEAEGC